MFWALLRQGTPGKWDSTDLPWHWSYLMSLYIRCENILKDWTLHDKEGHPPPKDIWMNDAAIELWRKDMEAARKRDES